VLTREGGGEAGIVLRFLALQEREER
jgi:hypothetical protein